MARVTEYEVKEVISTTMTEEQIAPFLTMTTRIVDSVCLNNGYSFNDLANIELALCAWMISRTRERQIVHKKIDDAEVWYEQAKGEQGSFWEMVKLADYKGVLTTAMQSKGNPSLDPMV